MVLFSLNVNCSLVPFHFALFYNTEIAQTPLKVSWIGAGKLLINILVFLTKRKGLCRICAKLATAKLWEFLLVLFSLLICSSVSYPHLDGQLSAYHSWSHPYLHWALLKLELHLCPVRFYQVEAASCWAGLHYRSDLYNKWGEGTHCVNVTIWGQ